jgi:penicillin amidase
MRRLRWKLITAVAVVSLFALAGLLAWLWRTTLPELSGSLSLEGLQQKVVVEREPNGVVHIRAQSDRDLFFAQGFVHAQDRLWQMDFQRRIGAGRLAELLGPEAVEKDRYLRTWGFYRAAEAAYARLSDDARAMIEAYVAGVNAYLSSESPRPPELKLLRHGPDPWTGPDVVVWAKMMAHNLANNRGSELRRYRLLARGLSPQRIADLMPLYPGERLPDNALVPVAAVASAQRQAGDLLARDEATRQHLPRASNNWVLDGSLTEGGLPLLANDVHLGLQLPSAWYLMHLSSPGFDVIGATLPGLPLVTIGRNAHIAWGVTNLAADVEDIYIVEERGEGGYLHDGVVRPFAVREERIRVRGGEPVNLRVRETLQGPVISDVVPRPEGAPALAVRWVGHDPDDTTLEAFMAINQAHDWEGFRRALERYVVPGQNFVYADREGHVGYSASGRLPKRRPEHTGLYPVPGDGTWDWQGYVPTAELPFRLDPPQGYVATANHRITEPGYPHRLSLEWGAEPYRAQRITELIEGRAQHNLRSMASLQQDTVSLLFRALRPVLKAIDPATPAGRRWRLRLLVWDGDATAESVESTVFHSWYMALSRLPAAETGVSHWDRYPRYLIHALQEGDPACTRRGLHCLEFAAEALDGVLAQLGDEPPPWGVRHRARLDHALLTHTPLAAISDREVPMGGGHYTVNVGWFSPDSWVMYHGATYRQVIDLSRPEDSLFVLAGGQSGNPLASGYAGQLPLWERGDYLPMRRRGYEVAHRLVLKPGRIAPGD